MKQIKRRNEPSGSHSNQKPEIYTCCIWDVQHLAAGHEAGGGDDDGQVAVHGLHHRPRGQDAGHHGARHHPGTQQPSPDSVEVSQGGGAE